MILRFTKGLTTWGAFGAFSKTGVGERSRKALLGWFYKRMGKFKLGSVNVGNSFKERGGKGVEKWGAIWRGKWGEERVFMIECLYVNAGGKEKTGDGERTEGIAGASP